MALRVSIQKSITNNDIDAIDMESPMSIIDFITNSSKSIAPDQIQSSYNAYLKAWYELTNQPEAQTIKERYVEFLKDISLDYSTVEERKYLSSIDYNDPIDLEILSSFISKKLMSICSYYNEKRESIRRETIKKKSKGSLYGTEKTLNQLIMDNLSNRENSNIEYDINRIRNEISLELEELYDKHAEYFDQIPDENVYDFKDLDYGLDIFIKDDSELIDTVFAEVSEELKTLKEADSLFDNKRKLTAKYLSTDFYYLSTGSTVYDFLSGKILDAVAPSKNLFNRNYPTTASTKNGNSETPREKGYFKPSKTSVIFVDGVSKTFSFNFDGLEPNSVYYFPDPKILGNNGEILMFTLDDTFIKRGFSTGNASDQPINEDKTSNYYGYTTKYEHGGDQYLSEIFDCGYISDAKRDIYGNLYGLFKISNTYNKNVEYITPRRIKSLQLNGGDFFDDLFGEGYNFDYSIADNITFIETIRSGLTAYTNGFSDGYIVDEEGNIILDGEGNPIIDTGGLVDGNYNYLFFRNFTPYEELIEPTESPTEFLIRDGGFFAKNDLTLYDDPISSDLSAFPGNSPYYYNTLYEGAVYDSSLSRALLDPSYPTLSATFTTTVRPSGNNDVILLNGGEFTDVFDFDFRFEKEDYYYVGSTDTPTQFIENPVDHDYLINRDDLVGKIFIKNSSNNEVKSLFNALTYLGIRYSTTEVYELSANVKRFEIANDTLFIETSAYMIIDNINFQDGVYVEPVTDKNVIPHSENRYNKISNRFKVDNKVYYAVMSAGDTNDIIFPEIYYYDINRKNNVKLFPTNNIPVTNFFNISAGDVRYVELDTPRITYSSRNEIFNISYILKDSNHFSRIHTIDFLLSPDVEFLSHRVYNHNISNYSHVDASTLNVYLSATPTISVEDIIII